MKISPRPAPFAREALRLLLCCLSLLPTAPLLAQVPTYTGVEIVPTFTPKAINASGQMAGNISAPAGGTSTTVHAALYSGGVVKDLGTLPGGNYSEATGINVHGDVIGNSTTASGITRAFLYTGGVMKDLGTLQGGAQSHATAINDAGQITGWADTLKPNTSYPRPDHAFLYSGGVMTDLGNISATGQFVNFSQGHAINALGQVVGWSSPDGGGAPRAFLYSGGQMSDLGTLGGSESRALGINDSGTVVGRSITSGEAATRAFRYKPGSGMTDLGTIAGNNNSTATAINNAGQIIGTSGSGSAAFVHTDATGMVKLATRVSGGSWFLSGVSAINDAGQIIAGGSNETVFATYFLLSPPATSATGTLDLVLAWNLLGNGSDAPINVATAFSDASRFVTVWKWIAAEGAWAFYAPSLAAQGGTVLADYIAANGYRSLTSIAGGEGFWVNAKQAGTVSVSSGNAISVATLGSSLVKGWNLGAIGVATTPKQFSDAQSGGVTTLWAWNAPSAAWYFYAPSLDASGGLASYISSKSYFDFAANGKTLGPGVGFWVNKP